MSIVKENDNSNSSENKELIKRTEVDNTPFHIISNADETINFGVFGRYKITEDYHTIEQVKKELEKITWNRVIQIITLVHEMLNYKNK